ncbi:MAG: hypothetical protein M1115_03045 [Actinobacteria bacterium]|nr:hypothetical protein [Actinomycetota bacterium]
MLCLELLDDMLIVDDLVVAVHRWLEDSHHPSESLDGHLDSCAEASWGGQQHALHLRSILALKRLHVDRGYRREIGL